MSKFKQALMISVMVFLGAFVVLSLVKNQMPGRSGRSSTTVSWTACWRAPAWTTSKTSTPLLKPPICASGSMPTGRAMASSQPALPQEEITGGEVLRSAMYPVDTGDGTRTGLVRHSRGTRAEPQLLLLLDADRSPLSGRGTWWEPNRWSDGYEGNGAENPHRSQQSFRTMGTRSR